jgi:hypothetical protein
MAFQVISKDGEPESPVKTRRTLSKELKTIPQGKMVAGVIGDEKEEIPEPKEILNGDELNEKTGLQNLIRKYIQPPSLGSKFTSRQCEMRFTAKVNRMPLSILRKLWDKPIPEDGTISTDEQAELQRNWENISP